MLRERKGLCCRECNVRLLPHSQSSFSSVQMRDARRVGICFVKWDIDASQQQQENVSTLSRSTAILTSCGCPQAAPLNIIDLNDRPPFRRQAPAGPLQYQSSFCI